jgi:hypothetical protein
MPLVAAAKRVIDKHADILSPAAIEAFFNEVYWQRGADRLDQIPCVAMTGRLRQSTY